MRLTGRPLLLLVALVAAALPVLCLLYWARAGRVHRGRLGLRLSLFVSCQLSAVLVVGLVLNDYGQFYSSWSDLLGTASTTPALDASEHFGAPDGGTRQGTVFSALDRGASPSIPASADDWRTTSFSDRSQWPTRGAIVDTEVTGPASGLKQQALVYLPPRYFTNSPLSRRMPVVEVLTGFPGTASNLVDRMDYPQHLLADLAAGEAQDMVLVMMRPAPSFPWDTECSDVPGGPQTLQFFSSDVPASIVSRFALAPTGWGTAGDSTGGYCSAKIAMMDPGRFTAAVVLSGYFSPETDFTTEGIFKGHPAFRRQNDLRWRIAHLPVPAISMLVATARDESGADGYQTASRWLREVRAPMSADELLLDHGGHNYGTWGREIPYALKWLSDRLPPPKPVPS